MDGTLSVGGPISLAGATSYFKMVGGKLEIRDISGGTDIFIASGYDPDWIDIDSQVVLASSVGSTLGFSVAGGNVANLNVRICDDIYGGSVGIDGIVNINDANNNGTLVFTTHQTVNAGGRINIANGSLGLDAGKSITLANTGTTGVMASRGLQVLAGDLLGAGGNAVIIAQTDGTLFTAGANARELGFTGDAVQTGALRVVTSATFNIGDGVTNTTYSTGAVAADSLLVDGTANLNVLKNATLIDDGTGTRAGGGLINGGAVTISGTHQISKSTQLMDLAYVDGRYTLDGGKLQNTSASGTNDHTVTGIIQLGHWGGTLETADGTTLTVANAIVNVPQVYEGSLTVGNATLAPTGTATVVLQGHNTYTGNTAIGADTNLIVEGTLGYRGFADGRGASYEGKIFNDGVLTFDNKAATAVQQQVLQGEMKGTGSLEQFSNNLLVLGDANNLTGATSNVTVGRTAGAGNSALTVLNSGSLRASGNLVVNSVGVAAGAGTSADRNNRFNLRTVVLRENAWQNPFINYASNTRFGGTAAFAAGSVWTVDTSAIRSGDAVGDLAFATGGFAVVGNAQNALDAGNTMYYYSLNAVNTGAGAGVLRTNWNNATRVSDIYVNSLLAHNASTIRRGVMDRVDNAMYRMAMEKCLCGTCGVEGCTPCEPCDPCDANSTCETGKKRKLSGNSVWANFVGRNNELTTSYADAAGQLTRFNSYGLQVGFDVVATKRLVLGTMFGYEDHTAKLNAHPGVFTDTMRADDYYLGACGGYKFDNRFDLRGSFGYGVQGYATQRYQELGLNPGVYRTKASGDTLEASFEVGRRFYPIFRPAGAQLSFRPVFGFDLFSNNIGGAYENRADRVSGLTYDAMKLNQFFIRTGSDAQLNWKCFRAVGGLYYSYLLNADGSRLSVMSSDGIHQNYAVGSNLGQSMLTANVSGNAFLNKTRTASIFGGYNGDYFTDRAGKPWAHNYTVGAQYRF